MDGRARRSRRPRRAGLHLRAAHRVVATAGRGRKPAADVSGARRAAAGIRGRQRLHPRRDAADHGAPVHRLVGIPDDRLLRADEPLRHAAGADGADRRPPRRGGRRHPRLGAVALRHRPARPRALRRHPPVRARRPAAGIPPRLGQLHLQLQPQRGQELPALERPALARRLPRRRPARRRRGIDALPRLLPRRGRVDPQPLRRPGEPRGDRPPAGAEQRGLRRASRRPDLRRGVDRVADGVAADLPGRPRLRLQVGHGLDARHARATSARTPSIAATTTTS